MSWTPLPAISGSVGCASCSAGASAELVMSRLIAVGFGDAGYSCDGARVSCETAEQLFTAADVEAMAAADPDHDWRIFFDAPLYDAEYQRQGPAIWVLVAKGMGFA